MKIYVAGPIERWQNARTAMSALRSLGHEITHDWTVMAEAASLGTVVENLTEIASLCIRGVKDADCLFVLPVVGMPLYGTMAELGAALALDKPVIAYLPELNGDPALRDSVVAWVKRAAFLLDPGVFLSGQYADCFNRLAGVENVVFERRESRRKIKEFKAAGFPAMSLN